jgi:hypothetical protein
MVTIVLLPRVCHPLGQSKQLQGMDKKFNAHVSASCKPVTLKIHLN